MNHRRRNQSATRITTFAAVLSCSLAAAVDPSTAGDADAVDERAVRHFETHIRPLFEARCLECHGPDGRDGGLRLDSRAGWETGGDSGPAVVPGRPDESPLLEALRYEEYGLQMPPDGRLKESEIAAVRQWIASGAVDPRTDGATDGATDGEPAADALRDDLLDSHWAYQAVRDPRPPEVRDPSRADTAIDRFLLARLEEQGRTFAPPASPEVLVRRVYFDLTGLPPTPEDLDRWSGVDRPEEWERLVDELLASPRFAEHWARRWFDVARYADSVTLRGFLLPNAWRYRDYVVDSFDRDRPYDEFIREQIAGDLLDAATPEDRRRRLAASSLLLLGNTNFEEQDKRQLDMDIVDEQLNVVGTTFLGQTIACARCHDHKFDPISTREYYGLAGILYNSLPIDHGNLSKWVETSLPLSPEEAERFAEIDAALADAKQDLVAARAKVDEMSGAIVAVDALPGVVLDDEAAASVGTWTRSTEGDRFVGRAYLHDGNDGKGRKTLTFTPTLPRAGEYEVRLAYRAGAGHAGRVPVTLLHARGETTVFVDQTKPPADGRFARLGRFRFEEGKPGDVVVSNVGTSGTVIADAVQFLPTEPEAGESASGDDPLAAARAELKRAEARVAELRKAKARRPEALTFRERDEIVDLRVHVRGSVQRLGETAPRGMPRFGGPGPERLPADESGRRELAAWIASPANPLTARVMANRIWLWTFGEGLVRTPDNFGTTGESPTHPELLDRLASQFVADGWSVKRLVRTLVLTRAYRQSSVVDTAALAADPDNRLWGRALRKRLPAEAIRDALLAVSGDLVLGAGKPTPDRPSDYGYVHSGFERSVYLPVFRNALPDLLTAFDVPEPSVPTGRRERSVVAPQALYLMNAPFASDRADATARRLLAREASDFDDRLDRAYRLTLGRPPRRGERRLAAEFFGTSREDAGRWSIFLHALIASPEFRYLD